jgi:Xaa-Pro aminopeptidase
MRKRQTALLARLRELKGEPAHLDGFLVTNLPNIRYLCGYSGSNGILLLTRSGSRFYTDFRYREQAQAEVKGSRVHMRARDLIAEFPVEAARGIRRLGFEKAFLSYGSYLAVRRQLKRTKLVPCENLVAGLRAVKDDQELALIARAAAITDKVFQQILTLVKPGVAEKDLASEIDYRFNRQGGIAFETIVASGPRGALPHAQPSTKKLRAGECVVFDLGARFQGYCSDMTRTIVVGKADRKTKEIYQIVLDAQLRAVAGVRAGAEAAKVDALARDYIKERGYGKQFGHGLGHGVGLEVHEQPTLSSRSPGKLQANSVVTVEPGIYVPAWGGVRIEDLVAVAPQGCRILSKTTKRLLEV